MIEIQATGGTGMWRWRLVTGRTVVHMGHRHYQTNDEAVEAALAFLARLQEQTVRSGVPWTTERHIRTERTD